MEITDIRVRKVVNKTSRIKAAVSVTFDDEFVVHDIKIIEGDTGLFIAMPSRKNAEGEFKDIAHPLSTEMRNRIQNAVIQRYNAELLAEEEAAATVEEEAE